VSGSTAEYGKWIGGVMRADEGAHEAVARGQMTAQIVAATKQGCACDRVDLIVLAVPAGNGDAFMAKIAETLGENPALQGRVDLG